MKKAQMETIGLVVIVTLLAFIFIFVLQNSAKQDLTKFNSRYSQLNADNLRSTILKTTICSDVDIEKEISNCICYGSGLCFSTNCKNELEKTIKEIIKNSMNITKSYSFTVRSNQEIKLEIKSGTCKNVYSASSQSIPYSDLKINLNLC